MVLKIKCHTLFYFLNIIYCFIIWKLFLWNVCVFKINAFCDHCTCTLTVCNTLMNCADCWYLCWGAGALSCRDTRRRTPAAWPAHWRSSASGYTGHSCRVVSSSPFNTHRETFTFCKHFTALTNAKSILQSKFKDEWKFM